MTPFTTWEEVLDPWQDPKSRFRIEWEHDRFFCTGQLPSWTACARVGCQVMSRWCFESLDDTEYVHIAPDGHEEYHRFSWRNAPHYAADSQWLANEILRWLDSLHDPIERGIWDTNPRNFS